MAESFQAKGGEGVRIVQARWEEFGGKNQLLFFLIAKGSASETV